MNQYRRPVLLLAAFASFLTASSARAADAFTWNPRAVRLDGERFTADTLVLGDYARITFGFDGRDTTFLDRGFMPILGFTLQGELVQPAGFGAGWGAYIDYEARGTQTFSDGVPVSATFTQLSYSIVGYNGAATFALDGASGAPTVGGVRSGVVTLGSGGEDRISGAFGTLPLGLRSIAVDLLGQHVAGVSGDGSRVVQSDRDGVPGRLATRDDVETVYAGGVDVARPVYDLYGQLWLVDRAAAERAQQLPVGERSPADQLARDQRHQRRHRARPEAEQQRAREHREHGRGHQHVA